MPAAAFMALAASAGLPAPAAEALELPANFHATTVAFDLSTPTALRFAPDGRMFVTEKSGIIKTYDSIADTSPTRAADLRTQVHNFDDRGLLGMALDPDFASGSPYIYVLYTRDAALGGTPPRWGQPNETSDPCPNPPGAEADGCVVSGALSRLEVDPDTGVMVGYEQPLITDWCQQYPSHSVGTVAFGADGALYASAGEGAHFGFADWGQDGDPVNPCGDPPGGNLTPPTAEGGALRAQDIRTSADPAGLSGSVIRVDKATGAARLDNPGAASPDPNVRRIVAHGFRNPFRFTFRPGTDDLWLGDVGMSTWEELDHIPAPTTAVRNFGWPCYEGPNRLGLFDTPDLDICEDLYDAGPEAVSAPHFIYRQGRAVTTGEPCPSGTSSVSALAFHPADGPFPASYRGALFFGDYSRRCIWVMGKGEGGVPDPNAVSLFATGGVFPVDLQTGPGGDLFYVDIVTGSVVRIDHSATNAPPVARLTADPENGQVPLEVDFDATGSTDPDGGPLTYAWDLDGDQDFDDSESPTPTHTYHGGSTAVRVRVTDPQGAWNLSAPLLVSAGNTAPEASIDAPVGPLHWEAGDAVAFAGSATDPEQGTLGAAAMEWSLVLRHCSETDATQCHAHPVQDLPGVATGTLDMIGHGYPSYAELSLTVTDAGGLQDSETVRLDPKFVELTLASDPSGRVVSLNEAFGPAPLTAKFVARSALTVSTPTPQPGAGDPFHFVTWSDGGPRSHNVTAGTANATLLATFAQAPRSTSAPVVTGTPQTGTTLSASAGAWSGTAPLSFAYRWQRCDAAGASCSDVSGATGPTHRLTAADVGRRLIVRVTAGNAAPETAEAVSAATEVVRALPPARDRQAPVLRQAVSWGALARRGQVLVTPRCPGEACTIGAQASLTTPGAARIWRTKRVTRRLARNRSTRIRLALPRAARSALRRALRRRRSARAWVNTTARDRSANVTRRRVTKRLR